MTLAQALEAIERGETPEQYKKRMARIRRLTNEQYDLEDAIDVLGDDPRADEKRVRLNEVKWRIANLI